MIELRGIGKSYRTGDRSVDVLDGVNLAIERNELVAVIGRSGSGKSTLMHILGLLDRPSRGEYFLQGKATNGLSEPDLARLRNRHIGFIFQSFHLLPRRCALDNVIQPLLYRDLTKSERVRRAHGALERVRLSHREKHRPNELSGGERQRVAIARALVGEPAVLLADEPTGSLDSRTAGEVMDIFHELHRDGQTVLLVTHDRTVAGHAHRVISLEDGAVVDDRPYDKEAA